MESVSEPLSLLALDGEAVATDPSPSPFFVGDDDDDDNNRGLLSSFPGGVTPIATGEPGELTAVLLLLIGGSPGEKTLSLFGEKTDSDFGVSISEYSVSLSESDLAVGSCEGVSCACAGVMGVGVEVMVPAGRVV